MPEKPSSTSGLLKSLKAMPEITTVSLPYVPLKVRLGDLKADTKGQAWLLDEATRKAIIDFLKDEPEGKYSKAALKQAGIETPYSIIKLNNGDYYAQYQYQKKGENVLGTGSFGKVKPAQNLVTGDWYAIKTISPVGKNIKAEEIARENKFGEEIGLTRGYFRKTLSKTGERGRDYVVAMKLIPGMDLFDWDNAYGDQASLAQFLQIAINMCACVEEAHKKGILIIDIKPENMMIDEKLSVHLIDLGQARKFEPGQTEYKYNAQTDGNKPGTIFTMAFESIKNSVYSFESDRYSVGATIADVLGFCDYSKKNAPNLPLVLRDRSKFPGDESIYDICKALLDKDPIQRPPLPVIRSHLQHLLDQQLKEGTDVTLIDITNPKAMKFPKDLSNISLIILTDSSQPPKSLQEHIEIRRAIKAYIDQSDNPFIRIHDTVFCGKQEALAQNKLKIIEAAQAPRATPKRPLPPLPTKKETVVHAAAAASSIRTDNQSEQAATAGNQGPPLPVPPRRRGS